MDLARPDELAVGGIFALPVMGGAVALARPADRQALGLGVALIAAGSALLLIGGLGVLYVPPLALLALAIRSNRAR